MKERKSPRKRLFTLKEGAIYLGRSLTSIRHMVWNHEIPVVRANRKQWVDLADLDAWITRNKDLA